MTDEFVYFGLDQQAATVRIGKSEKFGIGKKLSGQHLLGLVCVPDGSNALTVIHARFSASRVSRETFHYSDDMKTFLAEYGVTADQANDTIAIRGADSEYAEALEAMTWRVNLYHKLLGTQRFFFRLVAKESVRAALTNAVNNKLYLAWERNQWAQQNGEVVPSARRWARLTRAIAETQADVVIGTAAMTHAR